jgi:hypothetical protein
MIIVSVEVTSCKIRQKRKIWKEEVYGIHDGKEVYSLSLTNKAGNV